MSSEKVVKPTKTVSLNPAAYSPLDLATIPTYGNTPTDSLSPFTEEEYLRINEPQLRLLERHHANNARKGQDNKKDVFDKLHYIQGNPERREDEVNVLTAFAPVIVLPHYIAPVTPVQIVGDKLFFRAFPIGHWKDRSLAKDAADNVALLIAGWSNPATKLPFNIMFPDGKARQVNTLQAAITAGGRYDCEEELMKSAGLAGDALLQHQKKGSDTPLLKDTSSFRGNHLALLLALALERQLHANLQTTDNISKLLLEPFRAGYDNGHMVDCPVLYHMRLTSDGLWFNNEPQSRLAWSYVLPVVWQYVARCLIERKRVNPQHFLTPTLQWLPSDPLDSESTPKLFRVYPTAEELGYSDFSLESLIFTQGPVPASLGNAASFSAEDILGLFSAPAAGSAVDRRSKESVRLDDVGQGISSDPTKLRKQGSGVPLGSLFDKDAFGIVTK